VYAQCVLLGMPRWTAATLFSLLLTTLLLPVGDVLAAAVNSEVSAFADVSLLLLGSLVFLLSS
jgi:hypothetical protein